MTDTRAARLGKTIPAESTPAWPPPPLPLPDGDLWIFGYGSLLWHPDFVYQEVCPAFLHGYHRRLCIYAVRLRGTRERPGIVLGLDRGGSCRGLVFRVARGDVKKTLAALHAREMQTGAYNPRFLKVRLEDGRSLDAYGFVVRRHHWQYTGKLTPEQAALVVHQGHGIRGSSLEYLANTVERLDRLGISDRRLERILDLAKEMTNAAGD